MRHRFCLVFVVFYFAFVLILAVHLRITNDRLFYRLCRLRAEQQRLKQQLFEKQLQLESLINPAAVSELLSGQ